MKRYKNHYPIVRGDGAIGTVEPTPPDTPAMRTDLIPLALPRTLLNQYSHRNDCTTSLQVVQVAAQRQNPPSWMRPWPLDATLTCPGCEPRSLDATLTCQLPVEAPPDDDGPTDDGPPNDDEATG